MEKAIADSNDNPFSLAWRNVHFPKFWSWSIHYISFWVVDPKWQCNDLDGLRDNNSLPPKDLYKHLPAGGVLLVPAKDLLWFRKVLFSETAHSNIRLCQPGRLRWIRSWLTIEPNSCLPHGDHVNDWNLFRPWLYFPWSALCSGQCLKPLLVGYAVVDLQPVQSDLQRLLVCDRGNVRVSPLFLQRSGTSWSAVPAGPAYFSDCCEHRRIPLLSDIQ